MRACIVLCALVMLVAGGAFALSADEDKKPKTIKKVMGAAHKGGKKALRSKVLAGDASEAEQKTLLALYTDLSKNKPPKGDADAWKKRTAAIVKAAKALVGGNKGAARRLAKATNCTACHKMHRPS